MSYSFVNTSVMIKILQKKTHFIMICITVVCTFVNITCLKWCEFIFVDCVLLNSNLRCC